MFARPAGAFMIGAALILGGLYYNDVQTEHHRSSCQAKFNTAFVDAFNARAALSKVHADATDALLSGVSELVLHPKGTSPTALADLFKTYNKSLGAYNQAKADHPYPTLSADCR